MSREWEKSALCAQTDPDMFYPEGKGTAYGVAKEAKSVCARCEVAADCLEAALENEERWGIWGGLTYEERRPLLAERGADVEVDEVDEVAA